MRSGVYALRDSKQRAFGEDQPIVFLPGGVFSNLLNELVGNAPTGSNGEIDVVLLDEGVTIFRSRSTGVELRFDQDEMDAFVAGIRAGEFAPREMPRAA